MKALWLPFCLLLAACVHGPIPVVVANDDNYSHPTLENTARVEVVLLNGKVEAFFFVSKTGSVQYEAAEDCAQLPVCVDLVDALHKAGKADGLNIKTGETVRGLYDLPGIQRWG